MGEMVAVLMEVDDFGHRFLFCFLHRLCIHKGGAIWFFLDGKKKRKESHQVFSQSILGLGCSEFIIYC